MPDDLQAQQDALTILRAISSLPNLKERIEALEKQSKQLDDSLREMTYAQQDFQRQQAHIAQSVDELLKAAPEVKKQKELVKIFERIKNSLAVTALVYFVAKATGLSVASILKFIMI